MNKNEQNRVIAWRLKLRRQASVESGRALATVGQIEPFDFVRLARKQKYMHRMHRLVLLRTSLHPK